MYHMQKCLILLLWCFSGCFCNDQPPNVVFILADDYGWHDIGYHGSEIKTPVLDKLAGEGVKLNNYYVQPICTPTRSQLMSGKYQIHTGLQHNTIMANQANGLPLNIPTIADKLREQNYATHIVGKWHLGFYKKEYTPLYRGFDSHFGFYSGNEDYYTHRACVKHACGMDFRDQVEPGQNYSGQYSTLLYTARAQQIIQSHPIEKPLFLYIPLQAVHGPDQVPKHYEDQYTFIHDKTRRTFAGMVSCMDEAVGNITSALKESGLWNNTILIFSTDNGGPHESGAYNTPLRGQKKSSWEGGIRGVGFVTGPLIDKPGRISNGLIHVSDWFPTLLTLAHGSTTGLKLDGYNVWSTISHGSPSPRTEILHTIDPLNVNYSLTRYPHQFDTRVQAAIRSGNWKLITGNPGNGQWLTPPGFDLRYSHMQRNHENSEEDPSVRLFNIAADPYEEHDLADSEPDIVQHLLDRLVMYNNTAVPCRYPAEDKRADPRIHSGMWGPWE